MPSVSFDARTLSIDGKRLWIVSGSLHFQRVPRDQWRDRLHKGVLCGLNTIETPIFWNMVEPRPGSFQFEGQSDIVHFVDLCKEFGLHVILRPGPFVGSGWDLGGLPAWLLTTPEVELRTPNQPFLEASGRYFNALAKQLKGFQATTSAKGPIIMIQNESQWDCDDPEAAPKYLGELARYLREAGFTVPRINANNLWQGVEGEIDGWSGEGDMFATMRQLRTVRPLQPTIAIDYGPLRRPIFGREAPEPIDGHELQRQLGEIMSAAGQFNIANFCTGTSQGFWGGQASTGEPCTYAPTHNTADLIDEHGRLTGAMGPVRRLLCFASSFSRVLAHTEPSTPPVVIDPSTETSSIQGHNVTQLDGTQGTVLFVFSPERSRAGTMNLLMSDGSSLPVHLGAQRVHWFMLDVSLTPKHHLEYSSLCALTHTPDMLVLFGPAGGVGEVSINGTPIVIEVPRGRRPVTVVHEGLSVVVVSEEVVDETFLSAGGELFVGVARLDESGEPTPSRGVKTYTRVSPDGATKSIPCRAPGRDPGSRVPRIGLGGWECVRTDEYTTGLSPRYAGIPGPAGLTELGVPYGYGWYQATIRSGTTRTVKITAPSGADRAQLFIDGQSVGVLGSGPGAERTLPVSLRKGEHDLVALVDNMGRISGGSVMTERKGFCGPLLEHTHFKAGRSSIIEGEPIDVLSFTTPVFGVRRGDATHHKRISWSFKHLKKSSIFVRIPPVHARIVVVLNGEPVKLLGIDRRAVIELDDDLTKRGNNTLELALSIDAVSDEHADELAGEVLETLAREIEFIDGGALLTDEKADWSFAKWEPPSESEFEPVTTQRITKIGAPAWWRASFDVPELDVALSLDTSGLSKGVAFVNGRMLGRYFSATSTGRSVPPGLALAIPSGWIVEGAPNELVVFDEHGASPSKARIVVERR